MLPWCKITGLNFLLWCVFSGILGSPRTCLHAVLSILNQGLESHAGPSCIQNFPRLADLAYHLIYKLCANQETSGPTMRYLRTHDFLYRHLQHLPFQTQGTGKLTHTHTLTPGEKMIKWCFKVFQILAVRWYAFWENPIPNDVTPVTASLWHW